MAIMIEKVQSTNRDKVYYVREPAKDDFTRVFAKACARHGVDIRKIKNLGEPAKEIIWDRIQRGDYY